MTLTTIEHYRRAGSHRPLQLKGSRPLGIGPACHIHSPSPFACSRVKRIARPTNRGTSLIEAIVTMSVGSTLFLLATAWIHQSFFLASKMRDQGRHHDSLMRLSRQFRDDVHTATEIEMIGDSKLRMAVATGVMQYEFTPKGVSRSEFQSDMESPINHEAYRLLDGATVTCELEKDPPTGEWLTMVVERTRGHRVASSRDSSNARQLPSDLHVRARVGQWLATQRIDEPAKTEESR